MPIPGGEITTSDIWVKPAEEIKPVVEEPKKEEE